MQNFALLLIHLSYVLATVQPLAYILELTNIESFLMEYPELHVRHTFNSSILTGVSVNFASLDDAHRALQDPNVLQTWPVTLHTRPMSSYSIKELPVCWLMLKRKIRLLFFFVFPKNFVLGSLIIAVCFHHRLLLKN